MLEWTVPGYRTDRELRAADGAGYTVRAVHEASGVRVTLRFHPPAPDEEVAVRRTDARALADVRSRHVAQLYEHVETCSGGGVAVATVRQYVVGASAKALAGAGRLPLAASLVLLRAGLLALTAAHGRGVTHRAYKPENLLVDADGRPHLADFALTPLTGQPDAQHASAATGQPDAHDASAATGQSDAHDASAATGQSNAQDASDFTILCAADVRAAYDVFAASAGSLPRKLRTLAGPGASGDAGALLDAVDGAGRTAWGSDWVARGERELARLVAKAMRRER